MNTQVRAVADAPRDRQSAESPLTVVEAASYMRTTVGALHQMRRRHGGPPAIKIGAKLLFRRADIDAWLERFAERHRARDVAQPAAVGGRRSIAGRRGR
jgi:excisionase family DNA binding protein